jgi:GNAT superfamily N-acetyltransferase
VNADVIVRPARPDDILRMCELLDQLFTLESDFEPKIEKQVQGLSRLINAPEGKTLVLVAVVQGLVVGMASAQTFISTAEGGRVGFIEDVVVDRKYRRTGIGTRLLREIVDWSRVVRLTRLQLLADLDNQPALDFYSSQKWTSTHLSCLRLPL